MKKATSVVDESTAKRLSFAGMLMSHVGVLPDTVIEHFSRNEHRSEIPDRLLKAFSEEGAGAAITSTVQELKPVPRIQVLSTPLKPCSLRSAQDQVEGLISMNKMFGWELSTEGLTIPKRRSEFDRLIIVSKDLTNNKGFDACKASFSSWRYTDDLDKDVPTNERHPTTHGTYAVWFRDRVEADEELKNLSAEQIAVMEPKIKTITLLEREIMELVYFMEMGQHMDINCFTLCTGSRDSDGVVPNAGWNDGRFRVDWSHPDDGDQDLRAREAVSL